jgi:hypothetical protein
MFEADINCRAEFVDWLNSVLDAIDGPDAKLIHHECWIKAWSDAIDYARALALRDKLQPFGEPMQSPTYVVDYELLQKDIRDDLRDRIENLLGNLAAPNGAGGDTNDDGGTLDERAVVVKFKHPEWSDRQVADEIGCERTSLFKPNMVNYRAAKAALRAGREKYRRDL